MLQISFKKEDLDSIKEMLKGMDTKKQDSTICRGFAKATLLLESELQIAATRKIHVRTGRLRGSITSKMFYDDSGVLSAYIGSGARTGDPLPYAGIHEYGGTVRPVRHKYLTIPLRANKTAAGVMRFSASELISTGNTFVRPSKSFNLILFLKDKMKTKTKAIPMFVLVKSVNIPARKYLSETVDKNINKATRIVEDYIEAALNKAGK
jgi:phage gpG-like protein